MSGPPVDSGAPPAGPAIRASSLQYVYPKAPTAAVDDVSVQIERGEIYAVVGPNGSGKSTFVQLLTGALAPTAGAVELFGRPVHDWRPRDMARRLAVVRQREAPAFPIAVRDLVASGRYAHLGPFRSERADDRRIVDASLERCGIAHLAARSVRELSGGEFQRARLARALAQEPAMLILDEPTAALDVRYQMAILELLRDLRSERDLTVVFVTHRLELAARFSDRLLLLGEGRVVREGAPSEVLEDGTLSRVYEWPLTVVRTEVPGAGGVTQIVPLSGEAGESMSDQTAKPE